MSILQTILKEPLVLPKSFFSSRKHVNIQLSTEPLMSEKQPVKLQPNEDLVIKFEGLVEVNQHVKSKMRFNRRTKA
jgi:integrator complex subunit 7